MRPLPSIVFVNPPLTLHERYGVNQQSGGKTMPIGLASLAAVTRQWGYPTRIVDSEALGLTIQQTCEEILSHAPDIVGFTAVTVSVHNAAAVADLLKDRHSGITTLIGGHHVSAVPIPTLNAFPSFDIGVIGEGEETIVELLHAITGGRRLESVAGLCLRREDEYLLTPLRRRITDLDRLPLPAWDLLPPIDRYYCPPVHTVRRFPATNLVTSRGCPGQCVFCDRTIYGNQGTVYSAGRVMEMIRNLHESYGIREIQFRDDNFTAFHKRLVEFCTLLIESGLPITWSCVGRVDMVTPDLLALMKEAGCWQIWYGIESGSQKVLDLIKKGTTLDGIRTAVRWTRESGINPCGFFIIGHPGETLETLKETIRFALSLDITEAHATFMTPLPGAELYTTHNRYGTFDCRDETDWRKLNNWIPVFVPKGLTREDLVRASNEFHRCFFFRPKIVWSYLCKVRSWQHLKLYFQGLLALVSFVRKR